MNKDCEIGGIGMVLLTPEQARKMDSDAERLGMTDLQLMENAANGLCRVALRYPGPVLLICGTGNNGGDGYACARLLHSAGVSVTILAAGMPRSAGALHNMKVCQAMDLPIVEYDGSAGCVDFSSFGLIVDALLGTGFKPPASPTAQFLIAAMKNAGVPILSADLPSGMDGLSGEGDCVRADATVTFGAMKVGLALRPEMAGDVIVAGIGVPPPTAGAFRLTDDGRVV